MKTLAKITLVVGTAVLSAHFLAADDATKKNDAPARHAAHAFLGVYVSSVHPALAAASRLQDVRELRDEIVVARIASNGPVQTTGAPSPRGGDIE